MPALTGRVARSKMLCRLSMPKQYVFRLPELVINKCDEVAMGFPREISLSLLAIHLFPFFIFPESMNLRKLNPVF